MRFRQCPIMRINCVINPVRRPKQRRFNITFKVKVEATETLDLLTGVLSTNGINLNRTANDDGSINVSCTFAYKAGDNPFYIQFKTGKAISTDVTFTVSDIVFTEA